MKGFESEFERSSTGSLPINEGIREGWVAVSHLCVEDKKERRLSYGNWYKIKNEKREACIYRILRFSPNLKSPTTDGAAEIVLDWYGWLKLNKWSEEPPEKLQISFEPCSGWEQVKVAWYHKDQSYRLARRIAIGLGTISIILGMISIFLSLN